MTSSFGAAMEALDRSATSPSGFCRPFVDFLPITGASVSTVGNFLGSETLSASDDVAARLDELQFDLGEGPCWDAVRSGRALYAGISSYSAAKTKEAAALARELGTPLLIHQPSYSMLNRWIEEEDLLDELETQGMGCIVFSALAQGVLTDRYLDGVPEDSRAARSASTIGSDHLSERTLRHVRRLNEIAQARGQKLAQLALQWALRDPRVTSAVIGASSVTQLDTNLDAIGGPPITAEELAAIDADAVEADVNLWARSTES